MVKHRLGAALVLAALALGTLAVPVSAAGVTRWVDDDGAAGPAGCNGGGAAFQKVQKAIDASGKSDTVVVCPGVYREHLTIGPAKDGLTVRGAAPWDARIVKPADFGGIDAALVRVRADDVTIRFLNLVVPVQQPPVAGRPPGCGLGSIIHVTGRNATISSNRLRATGDTWGRCGYGIGVLVGTIGVPSAAGGGAQTTALVTHNAIRDFNAAGVLVADDAEVGVRATVERNSIRFWHLDTELDRAAVKRLRQRVRDASVEPAGFDLFGVGIGVDQSRAIVYGNEISSGPDAVFIFGTAGGDPTPGLSGGILTDDADGIEIRGNTVRRAFTGIGLEETDGALIRGNTVSEHFYGISLEESTDNVVRENGVGPGVFGIYLYGGQQVAGPIPDSIDNRVRNNTSLGHADLDCFDGTTGGGTDGTGNLWINDVGASDYPLGICHWD